MRFEGGLSQAERYASEREVFDDAEKYLRELKDVLEDEASDLGRRGFPIESDCRIDPRRTGLEEGEVLQREENRTRELERRWKEERGSMEADPGGGSRISRREAQKGTETIGELVETATLLAINKGWFDGFTNRLVAVRTSRFDDYVNGVDTLIIDRETNQPIAAIDETTIGGAEKKFSYRMKEKVEEGARVKYGFEVTADNAINPRSYRELPVFFIKLSIEDVFTMAKNLLHDAKSPPYEIIQNILLDLEEQARRAVFSDEKDSEAPDVWRPKLRESYKAALKIFEAL